MSIHFGQFHEALGIALLKVYVSSVAVYWYCELVLALIYACLAASSISIPSDCKGHISTPSTVQCKMTVFNQMMNIDCGNSLMKEMATTQSTMAKKWPRISFFAAVSLEIRIIQVNLGRCVLWSCICESKEGLELLKIHLHSFQCCVWPYSFICWAGGDLVPYKLLQLQLPLVSNVACVTHTLLYYNRRRW